MENNVKKTNERRIKRALRVRKHLKGDAAKPRLSVIKSNQHIYLQLIDDSVGKTLASVSTIAKGFKGTDKGKKSKESAKALGNHIAKIAIEKGITVAIFDRGSNKYHGVLAEVAEGARESGLKI